MPEVPWGAVDALGRAPGGGLSLQPALPGRDVQETVRPLYPAASCLAETIKGFASFVSLLCIVSCARSWELEALQYDQSRGF